MKNLKLFKSGRHLVVAYDRADARKVMWEEWGHIGPLTQIHAPEVPVCDAEEIITTMPAPAAAKMWGRGIAPQL